MTDEVGDVLAERAQSRIDAVSAVRLARGHLADGERFDELPAVLHALDLAERELIAPTSECRLAKPFAPIVQIGDSTGLHYECTHSPSHSFLT
ncbi:MAG: hypothetical protein ACR2N4_18880 [Jatrophihabitans sp.]